MTGLCSARFDSQNVSSADMPAWTQMLALTAVPATARE
ncbi:hypothetical protein ABIA35_006583 [Catenulispora sp. MAP12-49]